jgi:hypothetical protein
MNLLLAVSASAATSLVSAIRMGRSIAASGIAINLSMSVGGSVREMTRLANTSGRLRLMIRVMILLRVVEMLIVPATTMIHRLMWTVELMRVRGIVKIVCCLVSVSMNLRRVARSIMGGSIICGMMRATPATE